MLCPANAHAQKRDVAQGVRPILAADIQVAAASLCSSVVDGAPAAGRTTTVRCCMCRRRHSLDTVNAMHAANERWIVSATPSSCTGYVYAGAAAAVGLAIQDGASSHIYLRPSDRTSVSPILADRRSVELGRSSSI